MKNDNDKRNLNLVRTQFARLPDGFECPENMREHLTKIFAGEYDIPLSGPGFKILDIGANCGAFAVWAAARWPDSEIFCYEPVPETFQYLARNIINLCPGQAIETTQAAVTGDEAGLVRIYLGKNNCGEASLRPMTEQSHLSQMVMSIPPKQLPLAHFIKLDCEGSEFEILDTLITYGKRHFWAILVEWHSDELRRQIEGILVDYTLLKAECAAPGRGTFCYVHRSLVVRE